jgi:uncharacterized protein involved in outer membrane biogenesis
LCFLLKTCAALGALLAVLAVLFVVGIPLPGDFFRTPLERILTSAFGVPTHIEGPLHLRTGLVASAEANALTLADSLNPGGPPLARATRPSVQIDIVALLRRSVALTEVSGDHMAVRLERGADGRGNWEPLLVTSDTPAPVSFTGIGLLKISKLDGSYRNKPDEEPRRWQLNRLESSLTGRNPIVAKGTLSIAGQILEIDASSASLAELVEGSGKTIPVKATVKTSGTQVSVNGTYAAPAETLETSFQIKSEDGDAALGALGVAARQSGPLDASGKLRVSTTDVAVERLVFRLGETSASGSVRVNWAGSRPLISVDLSGERLDVAPFEAGAGPESGRTTSEGVVQTIHNVTTAIDLDAKISVAQFARLRTVVRDYSTEVHVHDRVWSSTSSADFMGMKTELKTDYSASGPKRVLNVRIEGSRFSTKNLPEAMRAGAVSATVGALRGEVYGSGLNTQEVVGSARVNLDMRDLRLTWSRERKRPEGIRFESARLEIARGGAAHGRIQGRHRGQPCSANVAGGTLPSLIAGERWPLRLTAACAGTTLDARGHLVVKPPTSTGEFDFTGRTNRLGTLPELLGLATSVPQSGAVEGHLVLGESEVRVRMAKWNVGRTYGAGQVSWPLGKTTRARINLVLKLMDIDELSSLAGGAPERSAKDPLAKEILPAKVVLPDLDLDLSADVARFKGESLRSVRVEAQAREGRLPPAPFTFEWRKSSVSGRLSADLRGERPSIELTGTTQGTDLDEVLTQVDLAKIGFHAGTITLQAKAEGVRLGELLSSATVDGALKDGKITDLRPILPGLTSGAAFSATLKVAQGKSATLEAHGRAGDLPFNLGIETGHLTELARTENALAAKLHITLGEVHLGASGRAAFDRTGKFRATLSGKRLDELGQLFALQLPPVSPYEASADVEFTADSIHVDDLLLKFGKSRVLGEFNAKLTDDRPFHSAELRAPHLHFEDLGLNTFIGGNGKSANSATDAAAGEAKEARRIARVKSVLNSFDAKVSLGVDALHSRGKLYAKLQGALTLKGGNLHVSLRDLEVAGGTASADFNLDSNEPRPRLRWRALAKGFEYGPLAKALDPRSTMEGMADLSLDVTTEKLVAPLLAGASGQVNAALYPREQSIGTADYWGTGLFHFVQRTIDPGSESRLNCVVGLFDIKDGLARSEALFADTTRVRIIGNLEANLLTGGLSGKMSPRAKNPALFTVDPSLDIGGTLESPQVTVAPMSFLTAPLQFILPLHSFALNWLDSENVSADGSDGCRQAFERAVSVDKTKPQPPSRSFPRLWPF